ncbi:glycoside hydrolase family 88 protein [Flavobacterium sp. JAS]|uniref:glycoside hydrolase family 88 protein n=1 Tax=Flavobacterium sp. JAS TaxID=2897329 RepID=UPI001E328B89|nr:glycoside hydrolase family 88 protein [Flavobacterium sp. JAS]MCD0472344.1 glycoside hydrolase family 88 protein [Flavobacterium sp. JAS]
MIKLTRQLFFLIFFTIIFISCVKAQSGKTNNDSDILWLKKGLEVSKKQLKLAANFYKPGQNPRSIWPDNTNRLASVKDWTCGFFPGSLWYMYEITSDDFFKEKAEKYTDALEEVQYFTDTHDLGFMLYCSYGNGYRLTNNSSYKKVLLKGSESLATRFSKTVGCIKSWDFGNYDFPVIIDNMINLELLMWASQEKGDNLFRDIAVSHADKTLANHFRKDNSSYHLIDYDSKTGNVKRKMTHQGYLDESAWARGQAWGLYGYVMMYTKTHKKEYLDQTIKIADFIMNHPRLPEDKIPFWDFDAPHIPHARRDVSAATVNASALLELSKITNNNNYFLFAESTLKTLSNDNYLSKPGENSFFVLKHSVGNFPNYSEIDTPLNYADYYYLEALIRYANIKGIDLGKI